MTAHSRRLHTIVLTDDAGNQYTSSMYATPERVGTRAVLDFAKRGVRSGHTVIGHLHVTSITLTGSTP